MSKEGASDGATAGRVANVSEWIAHAIVDCGVTLVFGGHGGALAPLVNAVVDHPELTWVYGRNEHDAATMAAAHAKLTGSLAVVIATSGPGATNLTTGLLEAVMDQVPVLAITGMKPRDVLGYSEFQDVNQSRLFAAIGIEWSKDAASPYAVIPLLRDAVSTAVTKRTAVHLAIPVDIQAATSPMSIDRPFCASNSNLRFISHHSSSIDLEEIQLTVETLVGKPGETYLPRNVIAVGLRAAQYPEPLSRSILNLAQTLDAPVLTRLDAKGTVDERHPLSFGVIGVHGKPGLEKAAELISTADCIISIGVTDETLLLCNSAGLQIRRCIEIQPDALATGTRYQADHTLLGDLKTIIDKLTNCVLASSVLSEKKRQLCHPSESSYGKTLHHSRHRTTMVADDTSSYLTYNNPKAHRRFTSVYQGTAEMFLPQLDEPHQEDSFCRASDELWHAMHKGSWKQLLRQHEDFVHSHDHVSAPGTVHPATVLEELSKMRFQSKEWSDAVIAVDVGDVTLWASLCLTLGAGSRTLYSERLGTMGYALNAAIAGILAKPAPATAVCLAGDGGFQMSLQELSTFQQMKRPGDKMLVVVFDNKLLGRVLFGFDQAGGCEIAGPDYATLAEAYGGQGARLDDVSKVEDTLKKALNTDGLFMVHVIVDPTCKADMATFKDKALSVMNSG